MASFTGTNSPNETVGGAGAETLLGAPGAATNPGANTIEDADTLSGAGGNDVIFGGAGADSLFGNEGNDTISGGNEGDTISGGTGADSLEGGDGRDVLNYRGDFSGVSVNLALGTASGGEAEGDVISGFEVVYGGSGSDTLIGDGGANTLDGGAGNDSLDGGGGLDLLSYVGDSAGVSVNLVSNTASGGQAQGDSIFGFEALLGGSGNDTLFGDANDNTIEGASGGDSMDGGGGLDLLSYQSDTTGVSVNLATGAASGGHAANDSFTGFEALLGGRGDDTLIGDSNANTLEGGRGHDSLSGGVGADSLVGGSGNDTYLVGSDTLDLLLENPGEGTDQVTAAFDWTLGANFENLVLDAGAGTISGTGNALDNVIAGNGAANSLAGLGGADSLSGGADNDTLFGGSGADTATGGADGNDTLLGDGGDDQLFGEGNEDSLSGSLGNDTLQGGSGGDTLDGGGNDDLLIGGAGGDSLSGGVGGADTVDYSGSPDAIQFNFSFLGTGGDAAGDTVQGTNIEVLRGSNFDDRIALPGADSLGTIYGGGGNDSLTNASGTSQARLLDGEGGDDVLNGDGGSDTLIGGAGSDIAAGGGGNDLFRVGGDEGADSINGGSGNDTLDLVGWGGPTDYAALSANVYGNWTVSGTDNNWVFTDGDQTISTTNLESVLCFAAGTDILTAQGEVPVEALRAGDLVATVSGRGAPLQPVLWIGRRRIVLAGHPAAAALAPVRIRAGALGEATPARDLLVSPDHCLFLDGVLVPARLLVNGTSIVAERGLTEVTYFHVEVEGHAVLLANGAAAESWLDAGNRAWFANAPAALLRVDALPEAYARAGAAPCAPVLHGGPRLGAIRDAIALRATQAEPLRRARA
ncbi:hypothetical protein DFH01_08030 [Falsiroseomonas bella]|uniref:Hedgehog/Intein (Hint) domain-containing protein n=1 Tax=Falsiroseomonas bella TaxID=2184016 RepID=A0A317FJC7_9PROT|nr:Hint domain-containing protein [Falsiroseomonas bella]PWS39174.1 hypothetical protein DFH01_08030 [Falsiroseomonas bella]